MTINRLDMAGELHAVIVSRAGEWDVTFPENVENNKTFSNLKAADYYAQSKTIDDGWRPVKMLIFAIDDSK